MKALFYGQEYVVTEAYGDTVELEPLEGTSDQRISVSYADPTLIIDPTDGELAEAKAWRERMPRREEILDAQLEARIEAAEDYEDQLDHEQQ